MRMRTNPGIASPSQKRSVAGMAATQIQATRIQLLAVLSCLLLLAVSIISFPTLTSPLTLLDKLDITSSELKVALIASSVYFLGGTIKGAFGIGMSLIAVPVMAFAVEPRVAVMLIALPIFVTNVRQAFRGATKTHTIRRYWRFGVSMIAAMLLSSTLAIQAPGSFITMSLGTVAIVFALVNLRVRIPAIPRRLDNTAQFGFGCLAGLIGGISGLIVIPLVAYLTARRLEKDEFVRVVGFMLMVSGVVLAGSYGAAGVYTTILLSFSALLVIPALLGLVVGEQIRQYVPASTFRHWILILMLLVGASLIHRAIGA